MAQALGTQLSCLSLGPRAALPRRAPAPFSSSPAARPQQHRRLAVQAVAAAEAPSSRPTPSHAGAADTYAVVEIGGHQLIVEEGRWYNVNRLEADPGSKLALGRVLALKHEGQFRVGQPYLEGVRVEAEVLEELKGDKVGAEEKVGGWNGERRGL
eukprot:scaffold2.g7006.t1